MRPSEKHSKQYLVDSQIAHQLAAVTRFKLLLKFFIRLPGPHALQEQHTHTHIQPQHLRVTHVLMMTCSMSARFSSAQPRSRYAARTSSPTLRDQVCRTISHSSSTHMYCSTGSTLTRRRSNFHTAA